MFDILNPSTLWQSWLEEVYIILDLVFTVDSECFSNFKKLQDNFPNASSLKVALLAWGGSWGSGCRDVSVSRSFHAVINRRGNVVGKWVNTPLLPGFVLQRLDDKGRARWELNRPGEEEKTKKKRESNGLEGGVKHDRPGQWVGVRKGRLGRKKAALTKVEVEVSPEEE